jgi:hypothetical protein
VVGRLFFDVAPLDAVLLSCGLVLFILAATPRTRFAYRLSAENVAAIELSGDAFSLHDIVPLAGAIALLCILVFSMPARMYAYVGVLCAGLLFAARRLLPRRKGLPLRSMAWTQVRRLALEPRRRVFALVGEQGEAPLLIFCPVGRFSEIVDIARRHVPGVPESEETLVR